MNKYKVLNTSIWELNEFKLVPIRFEDRFKIMKWRNEQIYHLRQKSPLTINDQNNYFKNVISKLFEENKPNQLLFSFLKNDVCVGYGGLVHINWIDLNAEISFIMDTDLEKLNFKNYWMSYLKILDQVAFDYLGLHKIFTYAFDLRPHLYSALENAGFNKEATLDEHCLFNGKYVDVIIHSKINISHNLK